MIYSEKQTNAKLLKRTKPEITDHIVSISFFFFPLDKHDANGVFYSFPDMKILFNIAKVSNRTQSVIHYDRIIRSSVVALLLFKRIT